MFVSKIFNFLEYDSSLECEHHLACNDYRRPRTTTTQWFICSLNLTRALGRGLLRLFPCGRHYKVYLDVQQAAKFAAAVTNYFCIFS
jgi:hypothetical protein